MTTENPDHSEWKRPPRYARTAFLINTALYWFSLYFFVPILSPYVEHQGGSFGIVGLVVSAYGLAQLLLRIPMGVASDRLGRRKPFMALGFVASILGCLGFIMAPFPWAMVLWRFVTGISGCAWVAFTVLYASYFPPGQTTRAMSYLIFSTSLSIVAATSVGGYLADSLGWAAPFWASVAAGAIGLFSLVLVHEQPRELAVPQSTWSRLRSVMQYRELLFSALVCALTQYTIFATVFGFVPTYALSIGASRTELGILSMCNMLSGAITVLLSGTFFRPRFGPRITVAGSSIIIAGTTVVTPYLNDILQLYASQIIAGMARGVTFPILMSLAIGRLPDAEKATAMGFFQGVYAIGMFSGPIAAGLIGGSWGYEGLFSTTAVVGLVTAVAAFWLPRR